MKMPPGKDAAIYTQGPIGIRMLKTAFAMLAGTLAMSGYNIVDTYFVGQLGKTPLAAIGFTFPVIMLIGCVFHGLGAGVMTIAAQAVGSGRHDKAAKIVTDGLWLIFGVSMVFAVLGYLTVGHVFSWFGAEGETLSEVEGYMKIWYLGCATSSLSFCANDLLVAVGDSKRASAIMVAGLVMNALIDPLFISGYGIIPAGGIRGASAATILSQFTITVIALVALRKKHHLLRFEKPLWNEVFASWRITIRYAVPASIGMLMMPIGSAIITRITAEFGDTAVAATAAAGRLEMVAFVFPMSLGISLMPMVAQNYGARLYSRIRACWRFSMSFAFCFLMTMAVIYFFFAERMVGIFSPDPDVQKIMVICMHIIPWGFCMIEIHRFSGFFYTGCAKPAVSAWLNALRILGLMIPLSLLALYLKSLAGLFWARLLADVLAGGTGMILSGIMVHRLPKDGEPPQQAVKHPFFLTSLLPGRLKAVARQQAHIDNSSSTQ